MSRVKVFGYVRVSLEEENPENQEVAIREFCERNNLELLKIFRDVGVSGGVPALQRPEFRKMIDVAEVLGIKTIVVYDLTRLGRDIFDVIETMKYLYEREFNVLFVKHPELNFSNEDSLIAQTIKRALLALLAAFAEMERSFNRERTKQALARLAKEEKIYHRPRLIHYIALWLSGKERFVELTPKDIERAKRYIQNMLGEYIKLGVPLYRLHQIFLEKMKPMYEHEKCKKAPKSYEAFRRLLEDTELLPRRAR